jgi:metal-responsive CopG/Arc/MetJ family transcriptional regulator
MGKKRIKGEPAIYDEKKTRATVSLTQAAIEQLDTRAKQMGLSRSELIEQFARGLVGLPEQETKAKKRKRQSQLSPVG